MIKAIETRWKGYRFRSRLEARWAVFFEALGLKWEYEPEGFDLGGGVKYLPDFRVYTPQGAHCWYDVKPLGTKSDNKVKAFEEALCNMVENQSENVPFVSVRVAILAGDPLDVLANTNVCPRCGFICEAGYGAYKYHNTYACGCMPCDFETPCGGDNDEEIGFLGIGATPHKGTILVNLIEWEMCAEYLLMGAARDARSARFEHGESPRVLA